jgi:hypothetical protein
MKKPSIAGSHNCLSYMDSYEEIKNYKNKIKPERPLSRVIRWLIFVIFLITNTVCNLDHGSIPASITEIQDDLKVDENTIGVFGSLVYLGNFIGIIYIT